MATQVQPDKAIIAALGPFKIEVVRFTSVTNDQSYTSRLSQPFAAILIPRADAGSTTQNQSATIGTGANQKLITFRDPAVTAQTLIVIGY